MMIGGDEDYYKLLAERMESDKIYSYMHLYR